MSKETMCSTGDGHIWISATPPAKGTPCICGLKRMGDRPSMLAPIPPEPVAEPKS